MKRNINLVGRIGGWINLNYNQLSLTLVVVGAELDIVLNLCSKSEKG